MFKRFRSMSPPSNNDQLIFESSPFYFTSKFVPSRIRGTYVTKRQGQVKLILALCDPKMRSLSDYNHFLKNHLDIPYFVSILYRPTRKKFLVFIRKIKQWRGKIIKSRRGHAGTKALET